MIILLIVINTALRAQTDSSGSVAEFGIPSGKTSSTLKTGIKNNIPAEGIKIFPNPAFDFIMINTGDAGAGYLVEIFDITGKKIISDRLKTKTTTLDLRNANPGMYMIRLSGNGQIVTRRIIKK